jgi:hypothetical protein
MVIGMNAAGHDLHELDFMNTGRALELLVELRFNEVPDRVVLAL